jgi:hypothetical protein
MKKRLTSILAALTAFTAVAIAQAAETPNFIVILIDDLGYADISPFGQTRYETPNLERMSDTNEREKHAN